MPNVPDLPLEFSPGIVSPTDLNLLSTVMRFQQNVPRFNLRQASAQTLTTATDTPINLEAEILDTDIDGIGGHDNVTNNTQWVCRYPGTYWVSGAVCFAANATGIRWAFFRVNGSAVSASLNSSPGTTADVLALGARSCPIPMFTGDILEIVGRQTSGGNLNTYIGTQSFQSSLSGFWFCR